MTFGSNLRTTAGVVVSMAVRSVVIGGVPERSRSGIGAEFRSGSLEQDAQPVQATPAGGTDAADRNPELIGDLRIGNRRIGHKHLKQPLPPGGQAGQGVTDDLVAFVGKNTLINLRPGCR